MWTTNSRQKTVLDNLGRADKFPVVRCYLECPYYDWACAICAPIKCAWLGIYWEFVMLTTQRVHISLLCLPLSLSLGKTILVHHLMIGLLTNLQCLLRTPPFLPWLNECAAQICTAATHMKWLHLLVLRALQPLQVTPVEFARLQICPSLPAVHSKESFGQVDVARNGAFYKFSRADELLYWGCISSDWVKKLMTRALAQHGSWHSRLISV